MARSLVLLNIMHTLSWDIGQPSCEEAVEESKVVETVCDNEVDLELGEKDGRLGKLLLKEASCPVMETTLEDQCRP